MAKRTASSQLTSDNWEDEVVEEEAGGFSKADEAEIRARLIKKAKRSTGQLSSGGVFSRVKLCNNGGNDTAVTSSSGEDDYLHQLECLNTSVAEWISQHVQRNPLVDLTPIFHDYEAYLNTLDQKRKQLTVNKETKPVAMAMLPTDTIKGDVNVSEGIASSSNDHVTPPVSKHSDHVIPFVSNASDHVIPPFGKSSDHVIPTATSTTVEDTSQNSGDDDDTIVITPKPPADQPLQDDHSLLAVRSKLFYKKNESYVELGVGVLRVKEEQSKAILLMRNDTTLGNILLNVCLSPQLPVSRAGKNNVLLMCPPNPPLELKPTNQSEEIPVQSGSGEIVTYLIRVKTTHLADQLFELIKKLQSKLS